MIAGAYSGPGGRPIWWSLEGSGSGYRRPELERSANECGCWRRPCQNGRVPDENYQRPGWFTTNVFNRLVAGLTRLGVSVYGSRVLEVKGRTSGQWRQTPVNLLRYEGADYLVAPRGHTQWVKNLRVSGQGRLRVGRRTQPFTASELSDEEKPPLLRAYLKKWKFEVGVFFGGVGPDSSDDELRRIAPDHPVFRLTTQ
jgi:deazaflavin-dependent oxidoreductase (nitroreductase family)